MTTLLDNNELVETEDLPVIVLNAFDRCDGCGAAAVTQATKGEYVLLFCFHHKKISEDNLLNQDWEVVDDIAAISRLS